MNARVLASKRALEPLLAGQPPHRLVWTDPDSGAASSKTERGAGADHTTVKNEREETPSS